MKMERITRLEEENWRQKLMTLWLKEGDKNTKFCWELSPKSNERLTFKFVMNKICYLLIYLFEYMAYDFLHAYYDYVYYACEKSLDYIEYGL
jgi:hypothetical protein